MSIRIFKSSIIREQLSHQELDDLSEDFRSYKQDGVLPDILVGMHPMMMTVPSL